MTPRHPNLMRCVQLWARHSRRDWRACFTVALLTLLHLHSVVAQTDTLIRARPEFPNQLYDPAPTNAPGTLQTQPASVSLYSGTAGAAGDARTPNDGLMNLVQAGIGQALFVPAAELSAPTIVLQPTNVVSFAGSNVTLSIVVSGTPPVSYQWFRNGLAIAGATNAAFTFTAQFTNAGDYSVVASNAFGSTTSQVATLRVETTFTSLPNAGPILLARSFSATWGDYNGDGFVDLLTGGNGGGLVFRNLGGGTFSNVFIGSAYIVAWADYDNDGLLDFVGTTGVIQTNGSIYRNTGQGTFALVDNVFDGPGASGAGGIGGIAWGDYNRDGWIDLFVANAARPDELYQNNRNGTFSKVTSSGFTVGSSGCAWGDFDNDGWLDVFTLGGSQHQVYHNNNGNGTFTRITNAGFITGSFPDNCSLGDYDNDGSLDVLVTDGLNWHNYLYHNNGNGTFTTITNGDFVTRLGSFGQSSWGDYDNDGWLDFFVTGTNVLYRNNQDGTFTLVTDVAGVAGQGLGSTAFGDFNNDGFLDLFTGDNLVGSDRLYRNNGNSNSWIAVRCVGRPSNRAGIGAKLTATAIISGVARTQMRVISGGEGRGGQNGLRAHFGLGDATNVATLRIEWPNGAVHTFSNIAPRQVLTVEETTTFQFAVNGSGAVSYSPLRSNYYVGEPITLTATPRNTNWTRFLRWSDGNTNATRTITVGLTNVLTAIFTNFVELEESVFKLWDRTYGSDGGDVAEAVTRTLDGGYLVAGRAGYSTNETKSSTNAGWFDGWLIRLDPDGNRLWDRTVGGVTNDRLRAVVALADGGFVAGGESSSDAGGSKASPNWGLADFWLVRLDSTGAVLWDRSYGGASNDVMWGLQKTTDGGFILAGISDSPPGGNKSSANYGSNDCWVVKVDAQGFKQWERSFGGEGEDQFYDVRETDDGGYLFAGYSGSTTNSTKTSPLRGAWDYWVVRTDVHGNTLWDRTFGGFGYEYARAMAKTKDGGFILSGDSGSFAGQNKTATNYGMFDFWVVRLDSIGNKLWDVALGGEGMDTFAYTGAAAEDGGYWIAGSSSSPPSGVKNSPHYGAEDAWLGRLDHDGRKRWDFALGGTNSDLLWDLQLTDDGGAICAGYSISGPSGNKSSPNRGFEDFWVVKLATREAPVGTPIVLVNGVHSSSNHIFHSQTPVSVTMTSTWNGPIHYSLDGSEPSFDSPTSFLYDPMNPPQVAPPATVKAIAYIDDLHQANGLYLDYSDVVSTRLDYLPIYTVAASTPGGGTVAVSPPGGSHTSNTVVTLAATNLPGWTFLGWQGNVTDTNLVVSFPLRSNVTAQAVFGTTLTTNMSGVGSIAREPALALYPYGSAVRLTALPGPGRFLAFWTGALSGAISPQELTVTSSNLAVGATFGTLTGPNFGLVVQIVGEGTVSYSPATNRFASNSMVMLTATPKSGWTFARWSGDTNSTLPPLTLVMQTNKAVIAIFSKPPVITSFTPVSGPTGTVVTITGANFDPRPLSNIVYFGAMRGAVTAGSTNQLTVVVPAGATYSALTVTAGGRTAMSSARFLPTFRGLGTLSAGSFSELESLTRNARPGSVDFFDFDRDGRADVLSGNYGFGPTDVFRNTSATGSMMFASPVGLPPGDASGSAIAADLDGDGRLDVITCDFDRKFVYVHANGSAPDVLHAASFTTYPAIPLDGLAYSVVAGDLDNDGRPDLIINHVQAGRISLVQNLSESGQLSFAAPVTIGGFGYAHTMELADLDSDQWLDIVVADYGSNGVRVLRNLGMSGVLTSNSFAAVDFAVGGSPRAVKAIDFDGDGRLDLATANISGGSVSILRNTTIGTNITFAAPVNLPLGNNPAHCAAADLNGDGRPDLVVAVDGPNPAAIYPFVGASNSITAESFASRIDLALGAGTLWVAAGDLNGDARPDIAFADWENFRVRVLQNNLPLETGLAPLVAILSPTNGSTFTAPASIPILVSVTDGSGSVTQVVLYAGTNLIGSDTSAPFEFSWNNVPPTNHTLRAVASDDLGRTNASTPVNITVVAANQPPLVSVIAPTNGAVFGAGTNITVTANALDGDGTVVRVEFFAASATTTNLIGVASNGVMNQFSVVWSNVAVGSYSLTARALDNAGASAPSAAVGITVLLFEGPPAFRFEQAAYSVGEDAGAVMVRVVRNFSGFAQVNYATADGSATALADYNPVASQLVFQNDESVKTITVPILEDLVVEGSHSFTVTLSTNGVATPKGLANPSVATVTILDNDMQTPGSFLSVKPVTPINPNELGSLRVYLTGVNSGVGQWRLPWERTFRNSGEAATGLQPGEYAIEFKPLPGHLTPPPATLVVAEAQETRSTNAYTFLVSTPTGSLTVFIDPAAVATNADPNCRGLWRIAGGAYMNSGATLPNLLAGSYTVEFLGLPMNCGWGRPLPREVTVRPGLSNSFRASYYTNASGPALPAALSFSSDLLPVFDNALPQTYCGQIVTEFGSGSGVVVKERVVLTAAHVVFDDYSLSWVGDARWFFQRHAPDYNPAPQEVRGYYVNGGYAARREAEGTPGVSQAASFDLDVAALYFYAAAGRGGFGGYLASDSPTPLWLLTNTFPPLTQRALVGYPVEGVANPGMMHRIGPTSMSFEQTTGAVFSCSTIRGLPGSSGGPLCVQWSNGRYFPAGIYVGGSDRAIVRAIDSRAVELINAAELTSNLGTNQGSGGVVRFGVSVPLGTCFEFATVTLAPPAAVAAGARFRVHYKPSTNNESLSPWTNSIAYKVILNNKPDFIELADAEGFITPDPVNLELACRPAAPAPTTNLVFTYVQVLPRLDVLASDRRHLVLSGVTNRTYRIEHNTRLGTTNGWTHLTNVTFPTHLGAAVISNALEPAGTNRFLRALRVP